MPSTVRARSCQAQVPLTWPTTPAPGTRTRSGNGRRLLLCLTSSLGSLMCWRGARRLNVLPSRPDKLSRWVFFHHYCCLTSKLCPAESIISFKCSLNTYFIRRRSIPVYQVHVCKGPEVLTRDIYFYWRTSLKCLTNLQTYTMFNWIWGFDTQKKRNKAANSICNDLFSLNIARALPSAQVNSPVTAHPVPSARWGTITDGISCQTLKCFDSVNKFMRTRLS